MLFGVGFGLFDEIVFEAESQFGLHGMHRDVLISENYTSMVAGAQVIDSSSSHRANACSSSASSFSTSACLAVMVAASCW